MSGACPSGFDRRLLSGLIDGELTQQDEQRSRLHLERCTACSDTVRELHALREATMTTSFEPPRDEEWREAPRSGASRFARRGGWALLVTWLVAVGTYAAIEVATGPAAPLEKLVVFAGALGAVLLLASVVLDRIRAARTDRYRGVER